MDAVLSALLTLFLKPDNAGLMIAIVLLSAMLGFSVWLHVVWRREERQDRKEMVAVLTAIESSISSSRNLVVDCLMSMQNHLSASTGKPVQ